MRLTVAQLVLFLLVLAGVAGGVYYATTKMDKDDTASAADRQAVFLTNGQVYFGEVSGENSKTLKLKNVYYLQVQQPLQPAKENEQPQVSLVKLGNELHGPKDEMRINREHVLFIEDMKSDSKVNQAIAEYIKTGGAAPTPTPSP